VRRRCPLCDRETEDQICPEDRMATLLAESSLVRAAHPRAGDVIAARYQIEEPIGHGGYGQVFRARHLGTGQDVALKVLIPQGGDESFTIKRFFLEARVTSGLKHANTIKVFDFGQEDSGLVYLAMELLSGCTLREELRARRKEGRPFTEREAIEIGIAITRSLGEAHAAGLVHRDLKPDNVFLHRVADDEPHVKVLDFGIVKLGDGMHTLSSTTSVPGTPAYMSPEHALNQNVDGRSDLYSLGVILYQMVTLDLPYRAESDPQTLYMHAYAPVPDPIAHAKTPITERFASTVKIALSKGRDERFRDARAMRDELKACLDPDAPPIRSHAVAPLSSAEGAMQMNTPHADSYLMPTLSRPRRKWERWAMIAGVLGILFSAFAVLLAMKRERTRQVEATPMVSAPSAAPADAGLPDTAAAPAAADPPATREPPAIEPEEPPPSKKMVRKKKRKRKKPAPRPSEEKKDLLHMRLEDLVESE
jgi:serine/threonine-protein kinase